ncbi:hypothetical protein V6Z11_D11G369000 [Gossypium hirsutum]
MVQLIRIQIRVPEYGWTTQKVFHFLNFLVNGVRALVFVFGRSVQNLHPEIVQHILLDMPSLAFFTTYALLILFWAEIYYQIAMWLILWWKYIPLLVILSKMFFAGLSLFAAFGFLLYGGRYAIQFYWAFMFHFLPPYVNFGASSIPCNAHACSSL